jgi:hypothetical protein
MAERINIFAQDDKPGGLDRFAPKPRAGEGRPSLKDLEEGTGGGKFVSREPSRQAEPPARAYYRTGRDVQFNTKVSPQTKQGFADWALKTRRPMGEILEWALEALNEKRGGGPDRS